MNTISELSVDTSRGEMMDINVCWNAVALWHYVLAVFEQGHYIAAAVRHHLSQNALRMDIA